VDVEERREEEKMGVSFLRTSRRRIISPVRAVIRASSSVGGCGCGLEVWRLVVNRKMSVGIVWVESH